MSEVDKQALDKALLYLVQAALLEEREKLCARVYSTIDAIISAVRAEERNRLELYTILLSRVAGFSGLPSDLLDDIEKALES